MRSNPNLNCSNISNQSSKKEIPDFFQTAKVKKSQRFIENENEEAQSIFKTMRTLGLEEFAELRNSIVPEHQKVKGEANLLENTNSNIQLETIFQRIQRLNEKGKKKLEVLLLQLEKEITDNPSFSQTVPDKSDNVKKIEKPNTMTDRIPLKLDFASDMNTLRSQEKPNFSFSNRISSAKPLRTLEQTPSKTLNAVKSPLEVQMNERYKNFKESIYSVSKEATISKLNDQFDDKKNPEITMEEYKKDVEIPISKQDPELILQIKEESEKVINKNSQSQKNDEGLKLNSEIFKVPNVQTKEQKEEKLFLEGAQLFKGLILRIFTTWGNSHQVGLTEIEVFNINGEEIEIKSGIISVRNFGYYNKDVSPLFNKQKATTDSENMVLFRLPEGPLEILISIPQEEIGSIRIWNYNKSLIESIKGAKEAELVNFEGDVLWKDTIRRGVGNDFEDYSTLIYLKGESPEFIPFEPSVVEEENLIETIKFFDLTKTGRIQPLHFVTEESQPQEENKPKRIRNKESNAFSPESFPFSLPLKLETPVEEKPKPQDTMKSQSKWNIKPDIEIEDALDVLKNRKSNIQKVENEVFTVIPELPMGMNMKIEIFSTWGDKYYLGLTGIEVFNEEGEIVEISNISADPPDINVLPEYGNDPRTVDKLIDGVYHTCDDLHHWLAPFTPGKSHEIKIEFSNFQTVSLIRLWNYNKNRIHAERGIKKIRVLIERTIVFEGEIRKASGTLANIDSNCEYILFTENPIIHSRIEKNDWISSIANQQIQEQDMDRPKTQSKRFTEFEILSLKKPINDEIFSFDERPFTSAKDTSKKAKIQANKEELKKLDKKRVEVKKNMNSILKAKKLTINLLENYGDPFYIGLTGLEILGNPIF